MRGRNFAPPLMYTQWVVKGVKGVRGNKGLVKGVKRDETALIAVRKREKYVKQATYIR